MIKAVAKLFSVDELFHTIKRFPFSVGCSLGLALLLFAEIHDLQSFDDEIMGRLFFLFTGGFLWSGSVRLIAESQSLSRAKEYAITFVGFAIGVLSLFVFDTAQWNFHLRFVLPALILFLMVSPFMKSGDDWSVWVFNRSLYLSVFLAIVVGIIFGGGLSLALFAIKTLFGVDVPSKVWGDVWVFAVCILGPIYGLTNVPKEFECEEDICQIPPGFPFIANWISVPIIYGYFAILYAYFIKVVIMGELPNGYLVYLVTGFVGAGIATYMLAYPLRESGRAQVRVFYRFLFPALLIPVGFQFFAIWERVSAYGITEQRYIIILAAVWFAMLGISGTMSKGRIPLKVLPFSLCVLLVLASFGPWGGVKVSEYSQTSRLEALLNKHDLLSDGSLHSSLEKDAQIPFQDRKSISSIVNYLCNSYRFEPLEQWFELEEDEKKWRDRGGVTNKVKVCLSRSHFKEELGFVYVSDYRGYDGNNDERFSTYFTHGEALDIRGFDLYIKGRNANIYNSSSQKICTNNDETDELCFAVVNQNDFIVDIGSEEIIRENLTDIVTKYRDSRYNNPTVIVDFKNDKIKVRLFLNSMNGVIGEDGQPQLQSLNFDMVYSLK